MATKKDLRAELRDSIEDRLDRPPEDVKLKVLETSRVETPSFIAEYFTDGEKAWFYKQYKASHTKAFTLEKVDKLPTEDFSGIYVPYPPVNSMASCALWPSALEDYGTELDLFNDICAFVHKWVEIPIRMEQLVAMYVMYTYCFEAFREAPYLRVIGDLGSGKTRLSVDVLGQIVYRPIRTIAASSMASIFRSLSDIQGSLVLDEADMGDKSDKTSEIVQLLNSGYKKGVAILRVGEADKGKKGYKTEQFHVFGPKIICSREHMKDEALESRCIPVHMVELTRKDIPLFTDDSIETDGQVLRNKLYKWRFDTRRMNRFNQIDTHFLTLKMSSRIKQLFMILSAVMVDPNLKSILYDYAEQVHKENTSMRGDSVQGLVLEVLREMAVDKLKAKEVEAPDYTFVFVNTTVTRRVNELRPGQDKEISGRYVGRLLRETLGFKIYRSNAFRGNYATLKDLNNMLERHGLEAVDPVAETPLTAAAANDTSLPDEVRDIARIFGKSEEEEHLENLPL